MTVPIITDDIRRAVYAADCAAQGHLVGVEAAVGHDPNGGLQVQGPPGKLPHIACRRCGMTWIILPDGIQGGYDAAETHLLDRLATGDPLRAQVAAAKAAAALGPPNPAAPHTH